MSSTLIRTGVAALGLSVALGGVAWGATSVASASTDGSGSEPAVTKRLDNDDAVVVVADDDDDDRPDDATDATRATQVTSTRATAATQATSTRATGATQATRTRATGATQATRATQGDTPTRDTRGTRATRTAGH